MTPSVLYHVTPTENVESIIRRGLLAKQPATDGHWQGMSSLVNQPRGVYASTDPEFWTWGARPLLPIKARVAFTAEGLPVERDAEFVADDVFVVLCDVPPDRIISVEEVECT